MRFSSLAAFARLARTITVGVTGRASRYVAVFRTPVVPRMLLPAALSSTNQAIMSHAVPARPNGYAHLIRNLDQEVSRPKVSGCGINEGRIRNNAFYINRLEESPLVVRRKMCACSISHLLLPNYTASRFQAPLQEYSSRPTHGLIAKRIEAAMRFALLSLI